MDQAFRLSFWHMEIARLIGEGLPNREIKKQVQVSDSRLSVLRANPLIVRAAERYRKMHEDKFKKALDVFANNAESVAQAVVDIVKNPLAPAITKLKAAEVVLEHAGRTSPEGKAQQAEMVFEQMLRITKRSTGSYEDEPAGSFDRSVAQIELTGDMRGEGVSDVIDVCDEDSGLTDSNPGGGARLLDGVVPVGSEALIEA